MVSALKINNKSSKGLDSFIKKLSKETTKEYEQEEKSFVDKSIQKLAVNSIIEGYFPKENLVKDMAIKRVNKKPIMASEKEILENPPSRSAKLRVVKAIR